MKKLLLLLYTLFIPFYLFAQNPEIYGYWELSAINVDVNPPFEISEVEPPITPWLSINDLLEYNGFGACNSFSGNFIYDEIDNRYESVNFQRTTLTCETELHDDIESHYFGYFNGILFPQPISIYPFISNDGLKHLAVSFGSPGWWIDFIKVDLAIDDLTKNKLKIYPNPAQDILFIEYQQPIETVKIYNLQGQLIKEGSISSVDVSQLATGLYLVQVTVESKTITKKFIKE